VATDLTVILEDRPGELAKLGETTGEAGINLLGMCAMTGEGNGVIHILVAPTPRLRTKRSRPRGWASPASARRS
jgi:hypothetical protein